MSHTRIHADAGMQRGHHVADFSEQHKLTGCGQQKAEPTDAASTATFIHLGAAATTTTTTEKE